MPEGRSDTEGAKSGERILLERLQAAPIVQVIGVVAPGSMCGIGRGKDQSLSLHFDICPWRIGGESLQQQRLSVRRPVSEDEFATNFNRIHAYDVIKIAARVITDAEDGRSHAWLEDFVGSDPSDAELNVHAEQLQEPVLFEDAQLGTFELDRSLDRFGTDTCWNGQECDLILAAADPPEVARAAAAARALWLDEVGWDRRIRACAAAELLPLKNEAWLDEDDVELTAEQFDSKLSLQSIVVHADGSFEFWFDDGDMFLCHAIMVDGNLIDGPMDAGIHG